jgi:hypothetical protein
MVPVQTGIPMPAEGFRGKHHYPWKRLNVGDSFLVKYIWWQGPRPKAKYRAWNSLSSSRRNAQRVTGWTFEFRAVPYGLRVWRTR